MPEEPSNAVMILPDEYQAHLDSLSDANGADSRSLIVQALNYVNEHGSNASHLTKKYSEETYDGSTFARVWTGSAESPGLVDLFGEKLVKRRP